MPTKHDDPIDAAMLICEFGRDLGLFVSCELTSDHNSAPCEWPDLKEGGTLNV